VDILPNLIKAFGLKIPDDQIEMIEKLVPQIPARLTQAITVINSTVMMLDARLASIELHQRMNKELLEKLLAELQSTKNPPHEESILHGSRKRIA